MVPPGDLGVSVWTIHPGSLAISAELGAKVHLAMCLSVSVSVHSRQFYCPTGSLAILEFGTTNPSVASAQARPCGIIDGNMHSKHGRREVLHGTCPPITPWAC